MRLEIFDFAKPNLRLRWSSEARLKDCLRSWILLESEKERSDEKTGALSMPEPSVRSVVFGAEEICGAGSNPGRRMHWLNIGRNRHCGGNPSVTASPCQLPLHRGAMRVISDK